MHLPVRGCRDIKPPSAAHRRRIVETFGSLARKFGFVEVEAPLLERADMYSGALGATSEVVSSEMFRVSGPEPDGVSGLSGERASIVLRPEGTAGIARAFAPRVPSSSMDSSRVWYAGPMFRYERPQHLRLRQFTQVGVECLGESSLAADFDCLSLAREFLEQTPGGASATLVLNSLGTRENREEYNNALSRWLAPRYQSLSFLSQRRFDAGNCMRILDSKLSEDSDAMRGAPMLLEFLSERETLRFEKLQQLLRSEGIAFHVDPCLVRGLDYYSSTAFEFVDSTGRAVCAGGRYENVLGASGVGFAAGLERLEVGDADGDISDYSGAPDASFGGVGSGIAVLVISSPVESVSSPGSVELVKEEEAVGYEVLRRLRREDIRAMLFAVRGNKVGKAVGRAVRAGARAVVVVGPDEVASNVVQLKLVADTSHESRHEQRALSVNDAVKVIVTHVNGRATS